jgi:hypothetical protein
VGEGRKKEKEERYEPALEQLVPPILDPTVNDAWTEITDRAASCSSGFEPFLKVGLSFVLIGWVNHPRLELAVELLESR